MLEVYRLVDEDAAILPSLLGMIHSMEEDEEEDGAVGGADVDPALVARAVTIASAFAHREDVGTALAEAATRLVESSKDSSCCLLDGGPAEAKDEADRSLLICLLVGALRIPDAAVSAFPWKEWHARAMNAKSGPYSSEAADIPDLMGLLKLVLSVGLLSKTGEDINEETVQILTDFEAFRGHYWGQKSAKTYTPRSAIIDAWGGDLRSHLTLLVKNHRSRMGTSQKGFVLRELEKENNKILCGSDSLEGLTWVVQALETFNFQTVPIDSEAQMTGGYHPYGARRPRRVRDLSGEQMTFLRRLATMKGLMSLRDIDYELHHYGFPSKSGANGLITWLSQLPPQE